MSLTDIKIRQAKAIEKPLKLADANGLYLEVKPSGAKLWRYRYRIAGKENLYAIGDYPTITLAEARKARDEARELIKKGLHPAHARQNERLLKIAANNDTFKAIAEEWKEKKRSGWAPYYLQQIERGMKADIYPRIGRLPIRAATSADILAILTVHPGVALRQWLSICVNGAPQFFDTRWQRCGRTTIQPPHYAARSFDPLSTTASLCPVRTSPTS